MAARPCAHEKRSTIPARFYPGQRTRNAYRVRGKIDAGELSAKPAQKPRRPQSPTPQVAANPSSPKILHRSRRAIATLFRPAPSVLFFPARPSKAPPALVLPSFAMGGVVQPKPSAESFFGKLNCASTELLLGMTQKAFRDRFAKRCEGQPPRRNFLQ